MPIFSRNASSVLRFLPWSSWQRISVPTQARLLSFTRPSTMDTQNSSKILDSGLLEQFQRLSIPDEDHELVEDLLRTSHESPKLVRSSVYQAPAEPSMQVRSWKMNEFKYYDIPSPFPTLARGLFTQDVEVDNSVKHRIVARGYDKFFNIGEVPWTTVSVFPTFERCATF